jgi:hypothetical protein
MKLYKRPVIFLALLFCGFMVHAQYKSFKMSPNGDTINRIDKNGLKQGKWVMRTEALRGEEGYEEEGIFKNDQKEGIFRRYTLIGDPIGFETWLHGGKDGPQQYYSPLGELLREESWKGYNPDAPYDTIAIYGTGNGEIVDYKIVKAEPYSVKHGTWKYYEPVTGKLIKSEEWKLNNIVKPDAPKAAAPGATLDGVKKVVAKTPEMLEWEKKNKGKKKVVRDGATGL